MVINVPAVALEWWRASGPRTRERLSALVEHYATIYCLSPAERAEATKRAQESVASWEEES